MDGFQAQCLRRILKIPAAFYSRVSNETVLKRARATQVSKRVLQQQLLYFGKIARNEDADPLRVCTMAPGSSQVLSHKPFATFLSVYVRLHENG